MRIEPAYKLHVECQIICSPVRGVKHEIKVTSHRITESFCSGKFAKKRKVPMVLCAGVEGRPTITESHLVSIQTSIKPACAHVKALSVAANLQKFDPKPAASSQKPGANPVAANEQEFMRLASALTG